MNNVNNSITTATTAWALSEQAQVLNYRSPKKEPERRSGRQKRNRNAGPVRSGSTGALKAAPVP